MKVVNLFGGPGSGKSTTAAGLFNKMKLAGHRVELVTEFAKDLTYEGAHCILGNQLAILGEQDRRLRRLSQKVDYAITDSPLLMGLIYVTPPYDQQWFTDAVVGAFNSYSNINIILRRVKPYQTYGRSQSELEARAIDEKIALLIANHPRTTVAGDEVAPTAIYETLGIAPTALAA